MDKKYIELFKTLAQATAASAEQVMDYDKEKNDEKGFEVAQVMRDNYQELVSKIEEAGDTYVPDQVEAARLLIGATVQVAQLQDRIEGIKKAMAGYQTDVIPKLQEVVSAESEEAASKIAEEKFTIEDNK